MDEVLCMIIEIWDNCVKQLGQMCKQTQIENLVYLKYFSEVLKIFSKYYRPE